MDVVDWVYLRAWTFIFLEFLVLGLEGLVELRREEGRAEGLAVLEMVRFLFRGRGVK